MAFTSAGQSIRLAVSSAGERTNVMQSSPQCRVYNEGPGAAMIRYGVGDVNASDDDLMMPAGLVEVHTKYNNSVLAAKCAPGESTVLRIIVGSGD